MVTSKLLVPHNSCLFRVTLNLNRNPVGISCVFVWLHVCVGACMCAFVCMYVCQWWFAGVFYEGQFSCQTEFLCPNDRKTMSYPVVRDSGSGMFSENMILKIICLVSRCEIVQYSVTFLYAIITKDQLQL